MSSYRLAAAFHQWARTSWSPCWATPRENDAVRGVAGKEGIVGHMAPGGTDKRSPDGARGRLVTLLTAAAVCVAVLGAGWTVQTALLLEPAEGKVIATKAMAWVSGPKPVSSTVVTGSAPPVRSTCTRGTIRFPDGNVETTAHLTSGGVTTVVPIGYPFRQADGTRLGPPQAGTLVRLALAGCPPALDSLLGGLLKFASKPPVAGHAVLSGRAVRTLVVGTKAGRVTVYLDAGSKRPLAVSVSGREISAHSRLTIGAAS